MDAKERLFIKQNGRCFWCGALMTLNRNKKDMLPPNFATFEHLIPKSQGGPKNLNNIVLACKVCNQQRGDLTVEEYIEYIDYKKKLKHKGLGKREIRKKSKEKRKDIKSRRRTGDFECSYPTATNKNSLKNLGSMKKP